MLASLSAECFPESFTCEVLVLQLYSWLFYRGSFQYRSSSRLSGTAPNWWRNLLRSQADWCFIIITTTRTPIPIISLGFRDIKGIIYTKTDYFLVHLMLLYLLLLDVSLALWNTSSQNKWTSQVEVTDPLSFLTQLCHSNKGNYTRIYNYWNISNLIRSFHLQNLSIFKIFSG